MMIVPHSTIDIKIRNRDSTVSQYDQYNRFFDPKNKETGNDSLRKQEQTYLRTDSPDAKNI